VTRAQPFFRRASLFPDKAEALLKNEKKKEEKQSAKMKKGRVRDIAEPCIRNL